MADNRRQHCLQVPISECEYEAFVVLNRCFNPRKKFIKNYGKFVGFVHVCLLDGCYVFAKICQPWMFDRLYESVKIVFYLTCLGIYFEGLKFNDFLWFQSFSIIFIARGFKINDDEITVFLDNFLARVGVVISVAMMRSIDSSGR